MLGYYNINVITDHSKVNFRLCGAMSGLSNIWTIILL